MTLETDSCLRLLLDIFCKSCEESIYNYSLAKCQEGHFKDIGLSSRNLFINSQCTFLYTYSCTVLLCLCMTPLDSSGPLWLTVTIKQMTLIPQL